MTTANETAAGRASPLLAHGAMLLFALFVSSSFTVGSAITHGLDPLALTFLRFVLAAAILTGVLAVSRTWRLPSWREAAAALLLGGLVAVFFISMFEALRLTSALNTGAIFALVPLLTAAIAYLVLRQRLRAREVAALLIAAAGTVFVVFDGSLERLLAVRLGAGERIFLVGCTVYAGYSPAIRRLDMGTSPLLVSCWTVIAGSLVLALYAAPTILATDWRAVEPVVYLGIVHLAVFTTAISFFLIQFASTRLPQAKVMAYTYLVPAFVLATDGLVGGAWPSPSACAGVAVIAAAMAVLQQRAPDHPG